MFNKITQIKPGARNNVDNAQWGGGVQRGLSGTLSSSFCLWASKQVNPSMSQ